MIKTEIMRRMDEAAFQAEAELSENGHLWSAVALSQWWSKWYMRAGHKRLGRILVALNKKIEVGKDEKQLFLKY